MANSVILNAARRWIQLWEVYLHEVTSFDTRPEVLELVILQEEHTQLGNHLTASAYMAQVDELRGKAVQPVLQSIQLMQIELNQHDVYRSVLEMAHAIENQYPKFVLCQKRGLYGE